MIDDLPSLLWVINLGCIDLNQWYATCDDVDRPGLSALRSRSRQRDVGAGARDARRVVREALETLKMPAYREDDRLEGHPRLRADRPRPDAERRLDVRQGARAGAGRAAPEAHDGGIPRGEAAEGTRARRLQPERVGPHAGVGLFGAAAPAGGVSTPVTWEEVDAGSPDRGLPHRQRSRAVQEDRRSLQAAAAQEGTGGSAEIPVAVPCAAAGPPPRQYRSRSRESRSIDPHQVLSPMSAADASRIATGSVASTWPTKSQAPPDTVRAGSRRR